MSRYIATQAFVEMLRTNECEVAPGEWAPARPVSMCGLRTRLRHAWAVVRGKADILVWPQDLREVSS